MPLKFSVTSDAIKLNGIKMLVFAPPGYGKTVLCSTLPNPIILSAEKGLLSIAHTQIPVIEIETYVDLLDAHAWLLSSEHAKNFESVALDTISDIAETVLINAKKAVKDPRQAYGDMNDKIAAVVRMFRDLPGKHVYFSAQQDREKDEISGMMLHGPSMPGKTLTRDIPKFFDEVFALGIGKTPQGQAYRFLRTRPDVQFLSKDRSGTLDEFEEPDLGKIIAKIQNKLNPKT